MAIGDILSGFAEAGHQHQQNLLEMAYKQRDQLSGAYAKLMQDESYPAPAREQFAQAYNDIITSDPFKLPKVIKKYQDMTIQVQPPAGPTVDQNLSQPAKPGSTTPLGREVGGIPAPTPPPTTQSVFAPTSFAQSLEHTAQLGHVTAQAEGEKAAAVAQAQEPSKIREIETRNLMSRIKQESDLAKIGYRPKYDPTTNAQIGLEPIPQSELSATQQSAISKTTAANELAKSKEELNRAEAEWAKSRTDPNSPVNQRLLASIDLARRRTAVSEASLGLRTEADLARYYGVDRQGNPLPGAVVNPDTGLPVGTAFMRLYAPTSATLTKAQTAAPVISQANDLIDFAGDPANADVFGKIGGRWSDLMANRIGTDDTRMAVLAPKIRSLASLLAPLHGFRSANAADEFARTMPIMDSPEAFAAAVREYGDVARRVEAGGKPNTAAGKPTGSIPTPPPNSSRMINVQLANGKRGQIPESQVPQFLKDNKGSKRLP